ncbi:ribonuclease Z [Methanothermococcus okinawensis]|uniref:Ribonuclease Z n=1 Tax=Methanothermococcus okinawensis (strain DSM 14208 / JCM 11175 / IH1) TaxID=647113 RepID=F8AKS1_METOI|nr:ribonuclease Z [Methanothermococcus okinawensis]AEH06412.1 Ribonuclease Z [Methanothermococcus okinawensis IH1]
MKIVFLGTGAAVPTKNRNHSSIGLKFDGEILLFDCGEGAQRQMIYTDISPMKINNIFITHLHGDHILGLPGLLQSIGFNGRTEPINIYGPPETKETIENILKIGYHSINFNIKVYELSTKNPMKIKDTEKYEIYSYPMNHSVPTVGYIFREKKKPQLNLKKAIELGVEVGPNLKRLKDGYPIKIKNGKIIYPEDVLLPPKKGICIGYSGDTTPLEDFGEFLKSLGCNILIHEATFDSSKKDNALETMHSTIGDAVNIAKIAGVTELILTHISARYDDKMDDYINEVNSLNAENNNLNITIAEDFMKYPLKSKNK